jgi:uncharacterized protein
MLHQLTAEEVRIIGALIEKELTTPEYYPLTVNSLMNACNQKSNRLPVVNYNAEVVEKTLDSLREKKYAVRQTGADIRVPKYRQTFTEALNLSPPQTAALTVLMLRGPQTIGEIKGRSGRMFNFENLKQVEDTLLELKERETSLVERLPRQTGMKEARFAHLLSGEPAFPTAQIEFEVNREPVEKLASLEEEIEKMKAEMEKLKNEFADFKKQLE